MTPESKHQSMEWHQTSSPVRVKAKQAISTRKVIAMVFWDRHGVLLVEFMQQGTTLNTATYYLNSSFGWEQFDYPPYSPDLALSDFLLFRYLKVFLGGKRFLSM